MQKGKWRDENGGRSRGNDRRNCIQNYIATYINKYIYMEHFNITAVVRIVTFELKWLIEGKSILAAALTMKGFLFL
jgi:hypothetical protein